MLGNHRTLTCKGLCLTSITAETIGGTRDLLTLERCVYVEGWSCFVHSPPSSHGCAVALTSAVSRGSGGQS